MSDPNKIGRSFQDKVGILLKDFAARHTGRVTVAQDQEIPLQDGNTVLPDFHVVIEEIHERRHYFLECQNRKKRSRDIARKIREIRGLSHCMTFFFVYPESVSESYAASLKKQGIAPMSLANLTQWVKNASTTLAFTEGKQPEGERVEIWQLAPVLPGPATLEFPSRLWRACRRAWGAVRKITRSVLIIAGLVAVVWHLFEAVLKILQSHPQRTLAAWGLSETLTAEFGETVQRHTQELINYAKVAKQSSPQEEIGTSEAHVSTYPTRPEFKAFCDVVLNVGSHATSNRIVGSFKSGSRCLVFSQHWGDPSSPPIHVLHCVPSWTLKWKTQEGPVEEHSHEFLVIMPPDAWDEAAAAIRDPSAPW